MNLTFYFIAFFNGYTVMAIIVLIAEIQNYYKEVENARIRKLTKEETDY